MPDGELRVAGNVPAAMVTAAAVGELHYFQHEGLYGFPVIVEGHASGNLKFWWLFADFSEPAAGFSKPLYWVKSVRYVAAMSSALYTEETMLALFETLFEEDPSVKDWDFEQVMDWLLGTFQNSPMADAVAAMEPLPADEENPDDAGYLYTFVDGSKAKLSSDGWIALERRHCVVPQLARKGKGLPQLVYRQVEVSSDGAARNWYQ